MARVAYDVMLLMCELLFILSTLFLISRQKSVERKAQKLTVIQGAMLSMSLAPEGKPQAS